MSGGEKAEKDRQALEEQIERALFEATMIGGKEARKYAAKTISLAIEGYVFAALGLEKE